VEHFRMLGYWVALAAAFLETVVGIGLLLPGSTIVLLMGFLAAQGAMDIGDLVWFASIGAVMGDNVNYVLGKKYGERWYREGIWFLRHEHFVKARSLFESHGGKSVFLGRFIPGAKEIVPLVAGLVRMSRTRFFVWNVLGAVGWSLEFLLTGFLVGRSLQLAGLWISRIGFFVLLLLVVAILLSFLRRWIVVKGQAVFDFMRSVLASVRTAVQENREVGNLVKAHPAFFRFLANRLDQGRLTGLPYTILSLAVLFLVLLLAGVVEDLIASDPIVYADIRTAHLLAIFRTPGLTRFFAAVTLLGKWQVVTAFVAAACAALWLIGKRSYIAGLLLSLLLSEALTSSAKIAFHRPRPDVMLILERSYSFPSGHSTVAVAFYGFLAYIIARQASAWKTRANYLVAGAAVALLIGFSRLYLGEHYLSDVWGGYLIGALGLAAGIGAREFFYQKSGRLGDTSFARRGIPTGLGLAAAAIVFYACFAFFYRPPLVAHPSPACIRFQDLAHIFDKVNLRYSETISGEPDLPIGFLIAARGDGELREVFSSAGWLAADRATMASLVKMFTAIHYNRPYPQAPVSPSFWNAGVNAFGFEKPTTENSAQERYRARVWKTPFENGYGMPVYAGTVCLDQGVKWLFTHKMSPDIDGARDKLYRDIMRTGKVARSQMETVSEKGIGENFTGDPYFTDGRILIMFLGL